MSKSRTINAFELLGVTEKSTVREARKAYYQLALIIHPDCGGHEESMKILVSAYEFVEEQIKNKNDITGDCDDMGKRLENDFEFFCKNQSNKKKLPRMTELYDLAEMQGKLEDVDNRDYQSYNREFNQHFEDEQKYNFEELVAGNPFLVGYGDLMDSDDEGNKTDEEWVVPTRNKFKNEISVYKEPHVLPDSYGNNFRYDISSVDDFSNYDDQEYDYVKAHMELENPPERIESSMDKPIKNMDIEIDRLERGRKAFIDNLSKNYSQINLVLKNKE